MSNFKRGPLLAVVSAGLLAGCAGSVEDRINDAVPISKELETAKASFDDAAKEIEGADVSALEADYAAQLKIRALECSRGHVPGMFSSKESIRKAVGNEECFKAADAKLQSWLGMRRVGWLATMAPLRPVPTAPAAILAAPERITSAAFATEAGVAVLQYGSHYAVIDLEGKELRQGESIGLQGALSLSPNGRLMAFGSDGEARIIDTATGETLSSIPELQNAQVFWAGDKGLVYARKAGGVVFREFATGNETTVPMSTSFLTAVLRPTKTAERYVLTSHERIATMELVPADNGMGFKPTLTNETRAQGYANWEGVPVAAHGMLFYTGDGSLKVLDLATMATQSVPFAPLRVGRAVATSNPDQVLVQIRGAGFGYEDLHLLSLKEQTIAKVDASALLSTRVLYVPSTNSNAIIDNAKVVMLKALPVGAPQSLADAAHKVKFEQQLAQLEMMDKMQQMQGSRAGTDPRYATSANGTRNPYTSPRASYGVTPPAPPTASPRFSPGRAGLVEAIRAGVLRPGGAGDLDMWKNAYMSKQRRMPGHTFDERTQHTSVYVITGNMTIPDNLTGAASAIFVVNPGVPFPKGEAGHSPILDVSSGSCIGTICDMYLRP